MQTYEVGVKLSGGSARESVWETREVEASGKVEAELAVERQLEEEGLSKAIVYWAKPKK